MAAKEETVFPFQEIVVDHCGLKPRIAASLTWSYTENVVRPAKKEITIYSRARFVHCTRVVVVLNEGMAWIK